MSDWIRKITDYWIPRQNFSDDDLLRRARLIVNASFVVVVFCTFYIPVYTSLIYFPIGVYNCLYSIISAIFLLFIFRRTNSFTFAGNFFTFTATNFFSIFIFTNGGIYSPFLPWLITIPVIAFTLTNRFYGIVWSLVCFGLLNVFWALQLQNVTLEINYPKEWLHTLNYLLIGGVMTFVVLIVILYENGHARVKRELEQANDEVLQKNAELESQNEEIYQQHENLRNAFKEITDNVNYAKRLQQAILGNPQAIKEYVNDAFVYFDPRDIVSGDFYWFAKIVTEDTVYTIIAIADCTGHGVSGAFMTVLGHDFLNEIVLSEKTYDPGLVLQKLDKKIIQALQDHQNELNDGMDIGILVLDESKQQVRFSGARHSLYYVQNDTLHQVKSSRFPIGSQQYEVSKEFETQALEWKQGTRFYMFTDGFQDQFGGPKDKKYLKSRFRNYLLSISHLPMPLQQEALMQEFKTWKGAESQTDDVLVMGLSL